MRKFVLTLSLLIFISVLSLPSYALSDSEVEYLEKTDEILSNDLEESVDDFLKDNEIDIKNPESISKISISSVMGYITNEFKNSLSAPLKVLGLIISIIMFSCGINTLYPTSERFKKISDTVGVLMCVSLVFTYITRSVDVVSESLLSGGKFMLTYVPIFSSLVAASGGVSSAGIYYMTVIGVSNIATMIANNLLIPLMNIYLAFIITESVSTNISISSISSTIKKSITWFMSLIMTVFVGIITIQSIIGVSADSVGLRTVKFVSSSFIPVIGSAISEAYSTVKGSVGLIRSGVGGFGILVFILTIIPPIISVFSFKIAIDLGSFVGEIMGVEKISKLLKNASSILSVSILLLVCFGLMLVVSTAVMMLFGMNL